MGCSLKTPFKKDNHFMKSVFIPNFIICNVVQNFSRNSFLQPSLYFNWEFLVTCNYSNI